VDQDHAAVPGTVLVVDDNDDIRELHIHCFTEAGFIVEAAADGVEAVALAKSLNPDAIVMDLQMPNMDGFEAARQIRAVFGRRTYLLAVSAHVGDGSRLEAHDAGFDHLIRKPIAPAALITIVRAALRSRPA
jgi:CheY-like chemotaxis protein